MKLLSDFMEHQGWKVTRSAYGTETGFEAVFEHGHGGKTIGFNSEVSRHPIAHRHNNFATRKEAERLSDLCRWMLYLVSDMRVDTILSPVGLYPLVSINALVPDCILPKLPELAVR